MLTPKKKKKGNNRLKCVYNYIYKVAKDSLKKILRKFKRYKDAREYINQNI